MTPEERVARYIALTRPTAKFVAVENTRSFIAPEANLGDNLFHVSLYDEQIDANLVQTKYGGVLIHNTYLASFAFNLLLCWLLHHAGALPDTSLDKLLAHNLKKFFAEQLYRASNRVPARALLLQTLLYEQVMMVEVFAAKERLPEISSSADAATSIMSLVLNMHELGHFYLQNDPSQWTEFLESEPETLAPVYAQVAQQCTPGFVLEFQCDAYGIFSCLRQFEADQGNLFTLRVLVFAFAAYAAMYSATCSAQATAKLWNAEPPEVIDLLDISSETRPPYETALQLDKSFIERARWVKELCKSIAAKQGLPLFGTDAPFPLPESISPDLLRFVGEVFECDDPNAERMSELVAKALYGHDAGMEYLYLRSKTFRTNRPEGLKLH